MSTDINKKILENISSLFEDHRAKDGHVGIDTVAVLSAFLFLRWIDWYDTEQEAIAAFEEKDYQPFLPWQVRWNYIKDLSQDDHKQFYEKFLLPALKRAGNAPHAQNLARIGEVLHQHKPFESSILHRLIMSIDQLPFESPKDYREAGKILEAILQKVTKDLGGYQGEVTTPDIVSRLMVELIAPKPGERIYDPCFGTGGILKECADRLYEQASHMPPRTWSQVQKASIFGIELRLVPYVIGLTRLVLAGIDTPGLEWGNTLERDILTNRSAVQFDCILAVPPWGGRVPAHMHYHFPIKTTDTVGLFVQHIMSALKPNGRAVMVLPNGFLFKTGPDKHIRRKLLEQFRVEGLISLPMGTFMPYTGIESNLVLIRKEKPGTDVRFMRVPELESLKTPEDKDNIQKEARVIAAKFLAGNPNSILWDTPVNTLSKRDWDLQVIRTGDEQLEKFFRTLQEIEDDVALEPLDKAAEVFIGFSYDKSISTPNKRDALYPLLRVADITTKTINPPGLFLTAKARERIANNRLITKPRDILVSATGTIGKIGIIDEKSAGAVPAKNIIIVRSKKQILAEYLHMLLVSEPYQEWLKGHARGSVIQHLSLGTLKHLLVPIPGFQVQERVYKTWKNQGGDPAGILLRLLSGVDMNPLVSWLESAPEVKAIIEEKQFETRNERLLLLEKCASGIKTQRNIALHQQYKDLPKEVMPWLVSIEKAMSNLIGINDIPPGPAKYSMLETVRLSIQNTVNSSRATTLPVIESIRKLSYKLQDLISVEIGTMLSFDGFEVKINPEYIRTGKESEVSLFIKNPTSLVYKDLEISTSPDYGKFDKGYLAEKEEISLVLHFPARTAAGRLNFVIKYKCKRLDGKEIQGEIPYSVEIKSTRESMHAVDIGESPYNSTRAVDRKEMFFGRKDILSRIRSHLTKLQPSGVILLEGNRRMGKTSILKRVIADNWLPGHMVILCSLQGGKGDTQAVGLRTEEIFRLITREIGCQLYDQGVETWLDNIPPRKNLKPFKKEFKDSLKNAFSDDNPVEIFETYLQDVFKLIGPKRLLFMLDEFDKVQEGIDAGVTSPMVPENLRYLIQNYPELSIMLVGSRRLKHLRSKYWSPLFGLGETMVVGPLQCKDAGLLVTEPVIDRLSYVPEAKERIVTLCACRANLIQLMCDHLFYMAKSQGVRIISYGMVEKAAKELTKDNEHFATLWDENCQNERQRFILKLCAQMIGKGEIVSFLTIEETLHDYEIPVPVDDCLADIEHLVEMELIERYSESEKDQYRISVPLFTDWLRRVDFQMQLRKAIREGEVK
jgi:type I restriction enzyme M protein